VGVDLSWQENFLQTARHIDFQVRQLNKDGHHLLIFSRNLIVHLVPLGNSFSPESFIQLQADFQKEDKLLVHLWEDIWCWHHDQVVSRIKSFLGLNSSLHGRKAKIGSLNAKQAKEFFNENHLQGYVNAKYYYGLLLDDKLVSAASFSAIRPMKSKGEGYLSAELVRFASKAELTIVGGLSKLIKHFFKQMHFNDLMSYADRDWSIGAGYERLGFNLTEITPPSQLYVHAPTGQRYFPHRLPKELLQAFEAQKMLNLEDFLIQQNYFVIFNTGNLKYHLYR
jgi:hypothetical protein